jgi:hypothetical protein
MFKNQFFRSSIEFERLRAYPYIIFYGIVPDFETDLNAPMEQNRKRSNATARIS